MSWNTASIHLGPPNSLNLLATALYGNDPKCALRENLQNAHDACLDWVMAENETFDVDIHVSIDRDSRPMAGADRGKKRPSLVIRDSRIGMTIDEIRNNVTKMNGLFDRAIASIDVSKRRLQVEEKVGRFGLSLLAGFIIADCIEIRTQKEGHLAVEAVFTTDAVYHYHEIDGDRDHGYEVRLFLRDQFCDPSIEDHTEYLLEMDTISEIVSQYCDLLPFPFFVHDDGTQDGGRRVTQGQPPWMKKDPGEADYRRFLQNRMGDANDPLVVIPIDIDTSVTSGHIELPVRARGVVYVPDPPLKERQIYGQIDLYVRQVFIRADQDELLPDWACCFCNGVLDTPDLAVTLDRNNVVCQDPIYVELQKQIGCAIIEGLQKLAETKQSDFNRLIDRHDRRIREAALLLEDGNISDFFKSISHNLPVCVLSRENPPPGKLIPLRQFVSDLAEVVPGTTNVKRLPYFSTTLPRAMLQDVVSQNSRWVIDATDDQHRRMLEAYVLVHSPQVCMDDIGPKILAGYVTDIPASELKRWEPICEHLKTLTLAGYGFVPEVKSFAPEDVPALMISISDETTEETRLALSCFLEQLGDSGAVREAVQKQLYRLPPPGSLDGPLRLIINATNPLWQDALDSYEIRDASKFLELVELILHPILKKLLEHQNQNWLARKEFYCGESDETNRLEHEVSEALDSAEAGDDDDSFSQRSVEPSMGQAAVPEDAVLEPPPPKSEMIQRHTNVAFPESVHVGSSRDLRVQIVPAEVVLETGEVVQISKPHAHDVTIPLTIPEPIKPGAERPPIRVTVSVAAESFEIDGPSVAEIVVPLEGKSAIAVFPLIGSRVGPGRIMIDFSQDNQLVGSIDLAPKITRPDEVESTSPAQGVGEVSLSAEPGLPIDVQITVYRHRCSNSEGQLQFILSSNNERLQDLPVFHGEVGRLDLDSSVRTFVDAQLQPLAKLAMDGDATEEHVEKTLRTVGNNLYEQLIPKELKELYWTFRERGVHTMMIVSDEPYIPWELLRGFRSDPFQEDNCFWGEAFAMTHWLRPRPPSRQLSLERIVAMAPGSGHADPTEDIVQTRDIGIVESASVSHSPTISNEHSPVLPSASEEMRMIRKLKGTTGSRISILAGSRHDLKDTFERGQFDLLHLACHGDFGGIAAGNASAVLMEDGEFMVSELSPRISDNMRQSHPLIFINGCQTGRIGFVLTDLGSWGARLVELGCGAFVGTLWLVRDESAVAFATAFYKRLSQGLPIGEALQQSRQVIRSRFPSDPTWLAYCCFANPMAQIGGLQVNSRN